MKVYDAQSIRNVALVGHSGAGKTQLVSALLFDAGAVNRFGRVDDGTTVTDYDDEEIARKHTLSCSLAHAEWNKHKINFIDTPGMANFLSDARAALRVVDAALVVVDAVAGAEVSTEKVWLAAEEADVPRIIVLNRLDRERASLDALSRVAARRVRPHRHPVQLPIGDEKKFNGVVDLVAMKAWTFSGEAGKPTEVPVPDDMASDVQSARDALVEMVAEADDALMEKFFDAGTLTQEELISGLKRGIAAGRVFPAASAPRRPANIGIQPLLDAIVNYVPSPAERGVRLADDSRLAAARQRPGVGVRVEDSRGPVRRPHHDVPRALGHAEVRLDDPECGARDAGASRPSAAAPGEDADQRAGDQGRRYRRRREAEGNADRRPAGRQGEGGERRADQVPGAGDLVRDRAEEPRRRGKDQHLHAPAAGRGPVDRLHAAIRRRRSCCSRARGSCTSR